MSPAKSDIFIDKTVELFVMGQTNAPWDYCGTYRCFTRKRIDVTMFQALEKVKSFSSTASHNVSLMRKLEN